MAKELWKGNEAIAEAALRAGVEAYFGYPITPQTELLEYMAREMPKYPGRVFLQAESELAAVNMVYGAACGGARVMSSSSSPGISLMTEGLSYIAGTEVPAVLVDVMRGGPGLGNIQPSQSDYFQMTKSLGHGDYHALVLAPSTVQEAVDLTYRVLRPGREIPHRGGDPGRRRHRPDDGAGGTAARPGPMTEAERPDWALRGAKGRKHRILTSLNLTPEGLEQTNLRLQARLAEVQKQRSALGRGADRRRRAAAGGLRHHGPHLQDGRCARPAAPASRSACCGPSACGPSPNSGSYELAGQVQRILVVEMNAGQMLLDVRAAVAGRAPVRLLRPHGRHGAAARRDQRADRPADVAAGQPARQPAATATTRTAQPRLVGPGPSPRSVTEETCHDNH